MAQELPVIPDPHSLLARGSFGWISPPRPPSKAPTI